jgi:predicted CoA-binding protein
MIQNQIEQFFQSEAFAVVGASTNRDKYGNKVLRCYLQNHKTVYPVNARETQIENLEVVPSVSLLPNTVKSISIITPPLVTEKIVAEAIQKGIKNIWMQPGAESKKAIDECLSHGINLIAEGPCILVFLKYHEVAY